MFVYCILTVSDSAASSFDKNLSFFVITAFKIYELTSKQVSIFNFNIVNKLFNCNIKSSILYFFYINKYIHPCIPYGYCNFCIILEQHDLAYIINLICVTI